VLSPRVTSIGNPELDPQFTNSIELNYTKTIKGTFNWFCGLLYEAFIMKLITEIFSDPENHNKL
jgi:hypothetical protein